MRHALMYHGSYEANFSKMKAGATSFLGSDGSQAEIPDWPPEADGLRIGYMEKAGKRFVAVRVMDNKSDVMLGNELLIDPPSHMGYGKRFGHEPTIIEDDTAKQLTQRHHREESRSGRGAQGDSVADAVGEEVDAGC
jgi:hypothetical protein